MAFLQSLFKGVCVIRINENMYYKLDTLFHVKKTKIPVGAKTDTHYHKWFSFYLTKNNTLQELPNIYRKYALFVVLPFANHTWVNALHSEDCRVGDLTTHSRHLIYAK